MGNDSIKIAKGSWNTTLTCVIAVCIAAVFCFAEMEKTTEETKRIAELAIENKKADVAKLTAQKELLIAQRTKSFEYRPIIVSYRAIAAGTAYVPSVSRTTNVSVSVKIDCTSTLVGGASGTSALMVSPDNITYKTIASVTNANSVSLAIAITVNASGGGVLSGTVPANYYYKVVNTSTTGTPTFTITTDSQETSL